METPCAKQLRVPTSNLLITFYALVMLLLAGCSDSDSPETSAACAGRKAWPTRQLALSDAIRVDPDQFINETQLKDWGYELDAAGLRATGTTAQEAYIDRLDARLRCAGVTELRVENVPITLWAADEWSLVIANGPSAGAVRVASYGPYTGATTAEGVTAPLIYLARGDAADATLIAGKIVLFDMPSTSIPISAFDVLSMGNYRPGIDLTGKLYSRPYLALDALRARLDEFEAAGAAGAVAINPAVYDAAYGTYLPFDAVLRNVPTLFVDRDIGAQLHSLADGTAVKLTLTAKIAPASTRNLIAVIPGMNADLTIINSHTDGTNSIEDNGPDAMIGIAQYLARLPREALPRSIMLMFSTGHFTHGAGIRAFLKEHAGDGLLDHIASIVTIEHLGAQEWEPDADGILRYTGNPELGAMFQPPIQALADASFDWFVDANAGPGSVLKPLHPGADGLDTLAWSGEGQYFYSLGGIPTANYIAGPTYLLNWGITSADKTDYDRMRRQMIAFAQMQLELSRIAKDELAVERPDVITDGSGRPPLVLP